MNIIQRFFRPKLNPEAFEAYWFRLPQQIGVSWFRNGKLIVGSIEADGETFMTQGRTADEFVDMVNETLYVVYEIPEEYHESLRNAKRQFIPKEQEYERLKNQSISKSFFSLKKEKSFKRQLA